MGGHTVPYKDVEKRKKRHAAYYRENREAIRTKTAEYRKTKAAKERAFRGAKKHALSKKEIVDRIKLLAGCSLCGYNKCAEALCFHHSDPSTKSISQLARKGLPKVMEEIKKCIVLCANCHAEEHVKKRSLK